MRKTAVTLAGLMLATGMPALAQLPSFHNPVISTAGAEIADPFVLKWNGEYYLYCSGDPIRAFHSTDLVHWDTVGPVLQSTPSGWNGADVWAPEVVYRDGKFYLYYCAARKSGDWKVTEGSRRIGVAVSESPRGPFVDSGQPLTPYWGIDPTVFRDPDTGNETLFASYVDEEKLHGAAIVSDALTGPKAVAGHPSLVVRGSEAWEDKDGNPNDGSLRYTNEAPTVIKRNGRYYLFYSGGSWDRPGYSLGLATGRTLPVTGLPTDEPGDRSGTDLWNKVMPPLLRASRWVDAPGHNCLTVAPNNLDDICVYHARLPHFDHPWSRAAFVDRVYWNHERVFMAPPSAGDQALPDQPQFADRFEHDGSLGASWQATGAWRVQDGEAQGEAHTTGAAVAKLNVEPCTDFLLEANVKTTGVAGVTLAGVEVVVDGPARLVRVGPSHYSVPMVGVYHQLLICKNGNQITARVDGVEAGNSTVFSGPAPIALTVEKGSAAFDGIALTRCFSDRFTAPVHGWETVSGQWTLENGTYHAIDTGKPNVLVKGEPSTRMEVSASLSHPGRGAAGVAMTDGKSQVSAMFDHGSWPEAHLTITTPGGHVSVPLPRGFQYGVEHTLRAVRNGPAFTFFLDGHEAAAAYAYLGPTRAALISDVAFGPPLRGSAAGTSDVRFSEASMKQLGVEPNLLLNGGFETDQVQESGAATPDNPWKLDGSALITEGWPYDGERALLLNGGSAHQRVPLKPGRYSLSLWGSGHGSLGLQVGSARTSVTLGDQGYGQSRLDFIVPDGGTSAEVVLTGSGAEVDDVYLSRS